MLREGISFYEHVTNEIVGVYVIFYFIFLMVIMGDNVQNGFENPLLGCSTFQIQFSIFITCPKCGGRKNFFYAFIEYQNLNLTNLIIFNNEFVF